MSVVPVALVLGLPRCISKIEAGVFFVTVLLFLGRLSEQHDEKGSSLYVLGDVFRAVYQPVIYFKKKQNQGITADTSVMSLLLNAHKTENV